MMSSTVTSRLPLYTVRRCDCCLNLSSYNISSEWPETMEKLNWKFRGQTRMMPASLTYLTFRERRTTPPLSSSTNFLLFQNNHIK